MGVYIKDYDAPKSCEDCDCELAYMLQCKYWTGRESDACPLVPVKTSHGRLIDADALKDYIDAQKNRPFIGCTFGEAMKIMIDEQTTVIDKETKDER